MSDNITVKGNPNEVQMITVLLEGEDLIKLKAFQKLLQETLDKGGNEENLELSLSQTIKYILTIEFEKAFDKVEMVE